MVARQSKSKVADASNPKSKIENNEEGYSFMSDQKATQSLHSPADSGSPTPTEAGADGSHEVLTADAFIPSAAAANGRVRIDKSKRDILLEVDHLVKYFPVRGGLLQRTVAQVKAVDDVSFFIRRGETLGLVGESGCGKTTVGRTVLKLIPATSGKVRFEGTELMSASADTMKKLRR